MAMHWRIQRGGALLACPPTVLNFLNFMQFLGNFEIKLYVGVPPTKILDPHLQCVHISYSHIVCAEKTRMLFLIKFNFRVQKWWETEQIFQFSWKKLRLYICRSHNRTNCFLLDIPSTFFQLVICPVYNSKKIKGSNIAASASCIIYPSPPRKILGKFLAHCASFYAD